MWDALAAGDIHWALVKAWAEMFDPTDPQDIDQRALNNRGLAWTQALDGEILGEKPAAPSMTACTKKTEPKKTEPPLPVSVWPAQTNNAGSTPSCTSSAAVVWPTLK